MKRFYHEKRSSGVKGFIFTLVIFVGAIVLFVQGSNMINSRNSTEQETMLNNAISSAIVQSYALNGRYPETLEDILEDYQITYNEEEFFIDYQVLGSNIVPFVTIISKN